MHLFVAIVLTLLCVALFNQRKSNLIYKADWFKVSEVKGLLQKELKVHFDSNPSIKLHSLTQICVRHHMDSGVNVILKPKSDRYEIIFARGKAKDSFQLTKSVIY